MFDISIRDIAFRALFEDDNDDMHFAIKAMVENNTDDYRDVRIVLQAIDVDGFEIEEVHLRCKLLPREVKSITSRHFIDLQLYKDIVSWQEKTSYTSIIKGDS